MDTALLTYDFSPVYMEKQADILAYESNVKLEA